MKPHDTEDLAFCQVVHNRPSMEENIKDILVAFVLTFLGVMGTLFLILYLVAR